MRILLAGLVVIGTLVAACTPPPSAENQPASPAATLSAAPFSTPLPTAGAPARQLRLWLPPEFAPGPDTPAGQLLAERLAEFEVANPGVTVSTRIKPRSGPAGLMETLTAAFTAAPGALPDIVTLDRPALQTAAVKSMIVPLAALATTPASPEWTQDAVAASQVDGTFFGVPIGSDADVLAYRVDVYGSPPLDWSDLLNGPKPFVFPANDPQASFTLGQYLALGGTLTDAAGRPALATDPLTDLLAFYDALHQAGVLPLSSTQMTSSQETWAAVRDGRAASAAAPLSTYLLAADPDRLAALPAPTRTAPGITLLRPWTWAVLTRDPEQQRLTVQLLAWLSEPSFLGPWTHALGILPPTTASLSAWPEAGDSATAKALLAAAQVLPSEEALTILGPPLQEAALSVINGRLTPQAAAEAAIEAIRNP